MSNLAEVMPAMPTQAPATTALSNNGIFQFGNFIEAMNAADLLARSAIVPDLYRYVDSNGNHNQNANANCLLALNMAQRMGYDVAPHTGAWIETSSWMPNKRKSIVAPHTGAWIETR